MNAVVLVAGRDVRSGWAVPALLLDIVKMARTLALLPGIGLWLVLTAAGPLAAQESGVLAGRVVDVAQQPVTGAAVFAYNTGNTRRPADYLSAPADDAGAYRLPLPAGHYWIVARFRQGEQKYGPLLPGDKHSGAAQEIDITAGETVEQEFVVADLKETSQLEIKRDTSFLPVEGVLLTKEGKPLENAYAFAQRSATGRGVPDYVSAWTDASGNYKLFLPAGTYWLGMAHKFPPDPGTKGWQKVTIDNPAKNINIVIQ
jgi:hypothetical protein